MKNRILSMVMILCCAVSAKAQNAVMKDIGGFENPESVAAYKDFLFVSNMGPKMEPTAKDGDGYISKLSRKDGKVIEQKYYTGLNAPKGIYIRCHTMYVADVDKVVAIDLKTKKLLYTVDFSKFGTNYLNDITRAGCGSLFVSSTDKNAVYRFCKNGKIKQLPVKGTIEGANGLYRGCGKLYIANYGRDRVADGSYGVICLCSKKYKMFKNGGIFDGIQRSCGRLILSDWGRPDDKGRLIVYKPFKKEMVELALGRSINGPSDIFRDCKTHLLWIPAMREGKIISVSMGDLKKLACKKKK